MDNGDRRSRRTDYEKAIIPEDRLSLLSRYDASAAHYEVVSTKDGTSER